MKPFLKGFIQKTNFLLIFHEKGQDPKTRQTFFLDLGLVVYGFVLCKESGSLSVVWPMIQPLL